MTRTKMAMEKIGDECFYSLRIKVSTKPSAYWRDGKAQYKTIIRAENKGDFFSQIHELSEELKAIQKEEQ